MWWEPQPISQPLRTKAPSAQPFRTSPGNLGRGVTNVAFGALELPLKMYEVNFEEGGFAACTYGSSTDSAMWWSVKSSAVVDIATFLVPLPGCRQDPNEAGWGYGPIMRPEWIITPDKNYYNFVYPSSATMN